MRLRRRKVCHRLNAQHVKPSRDNRMLSPQPPQLAIPNRSRPEKTSRSGNSRRTSLMRAPRWRLTNPGRRNRVDSAQLAEELPDVADEQVEGLHGGEVAAAVEL